MRPFRCNQVKMKLHWNKVGSKPVTRCSVGREHRVREKGVWQWWVVAETEARTQQGKNTGETPPPL